MKIRIIYFILPVIIGLIASATGFSLVWRLFILSILVPLFCYLWTYFSLRNLGSQIRSLPPQGQVGDVIEDQVKLTNLSKLPKALLHVKEESDLPDYVNVASFNLLSKATLVVQNKVHLTRRGVFHLGSYEISGGDPLGLFKQTKRIGQPTEILVYPNLIELPVFEPLTYVNLGYGAGRWLENQISPNVASIRDYVSGDSLKHIHWKSAAHSSKLMVKVFDPDRSRSSVKSIWVVTDMSASSQWGSGVDSTEEYAVTITASILKRFIEEGWPVGLIASSQRPQIFQPEMGNYHLEKMVHSLALIKADGQAPIEQVITTEISRFGINVLLVVITASWTQSLVTTMVQAKGQQGVPVAILMDPRSFGGQAASDYVPRSLSQKGVQVYLVNRGDNLSSALDSRRITTSNVL